jgi:hypothetical protein
MKRTNLQGAGARAAAVADDPAAARAAALTAAPTLVEATLGVEVVRAGSRGDPVTVRVTYLDPVRVPFVGWLVGDGVTIATTAVTRQEFG